MRELSAVFKVIQQVWAEALLLPTLLPCFSSVPVLPSSSSAPTQLPKFPGLPQLHWAGKAYRGRCPGSSHPAAAVSSPSARAQ